MLGRHINQCTGPAIGSLPRNLVASAQSTWIVQGGAQEDRLEVLFPVAMKQNVVTSIITYTCNKISKYVWFKTSDVSVLLWKGSNNKHHIVFWLPRYLQINSMPCIFNPYPMAFPYGNDMVLHFYQQQESSTTKTVHKVINKGLKMYV